MSRKKQTNPEGISPKQAPNWNYEERVSEIEQIIQQIESGSLPLEEVFKKFAVATEYLKDCETFLNRGKQQMNLSIETLQDFDDSSQ